MKEPILSLNDRFLAAMTMNMVPDSSTGRVIAALAQTPLKRLTALFNHAALRKKTLRDLLQMNWTKIQHKGLTAFQCHEAIIVLLCRVDDSEVVYDIEVL